MGVAWTRGHCSRAPPPGRAAGSCRGSRLPWGGEAEHLLGQEEAVLRVPHPVLHAPAAPHGERDVAGHCGDRLSLNADHCRGAGRGQQRQTDTQRADTKETDMWGTHTRKADADTKIGTNPEVQGTHTHRNTTQR